MTADDGLWAGAPCQVAEESFRFQVGEGSRAEEVFEVDVRKAPQRQARGKKAADFLRRIAWDGIESFENRLMHRLAPGVAAQKAPGVFARFSPGLAPAQDAQRQSLSFNNG